MAEKVIAIKVDVQGTGDQVKRLAQLEKGVKELTDERKRLNKAVKDGTITQDQFSKRIAKVNTQLKGTRSELNKTRNGVLGIQGFTEKLGGSFKQLGTSISSAFVGLFAVEKFVSAITDLVNLAGELEELTAQIERFGDVSEGTAQKVAGSIQAISDVYEKDAKEVLTAANTVAKQFGITIEESTQLIQEGFAAGSDASGEFLDILKEYPALLDEVGLTAEQSFALINQQVNDGIYSDKGVDAIKEAGLRLRELTPAAREALDGIGLSSDEIAKSLEDGSKSVFEVIQEVSTQLGTLPPQSAEVGTAIADIFGGPGEDAGLKFLTTLGNIDLEYANITKNVDGLGEASNRLVDAQAESNRLLTAFADGGSEGFTNLKARGVEFNNKVIKVGATLLNTFILRIKQAAGAFKALFSEGIEGFRREINRDLIAEQKKLLEEQNKAAEEQKKANKQAAADAKVNADNDAKELARVRKLKEERKKANEERKKAETEAAKERERLEKESAKNTEKLIKQTTKLRQEAEILSIKDKRKAEDRKLEIAEDNALKEIELTNATEEAKLDAKIATEAKFEAEREKLVKKRAEEDKKVADKELEKQKTEDKKKLDEQKAFEDQVKSQATDLAEQTATALVDVTNRRVERQKTLELAALDARLEQGLISQADFEKEREAIERRAFQKQKRLEIAQIQISLARELASIAANSAGNPLNAFTAGTAGFIQNRTLAGLAIARAAVQTGVVASQQFAEGGYTGSGFGSPDSSGFKQAGIVHEGEYVVPKHVLESQRGGQLVGALESMRTNRPAPFSSIGFANGGFTSAPSSVDMTGLRNEIAAAVSETINNIQVVNVASETVSEAVRVNNIQAEASFG